MGEKVHLQHFLQVRKRLRGSAMLGAELGVDKVQRCALDCDAGEQSG